MTKAKKIILANQFQNEPKETDLQLIVKDGEILAEAEWLSVDPCMRNYANKLTTGDTMMGYQVAKFKSLCLLELVFLECQDFPRMTKAKKFVYAKKFENEPKESDLQLVEEDLPPLQYGDVLLEAVWLSVDPYMRGFANHLPTGSTMVGTQVAKVVESKNSKYKVGQLLVGPFGWRTKTVYNPSTFKRVDERFVVHDLPDFKGLPESLGVGVLGMPGTTAYFGFLEICKPKPGEVVVVSGAAGAVGSIVGQIAKIKGCKVIGFAGSDDKVKWLKIDLGFDAAYNYKTKDISEALKEAAPEGVDCYFDNVGGSISSAVIHHMRLYGRVSICGSISAYNDLANLPEAPIIQPSIVSNQLKIEGFQANDWNDRYLEGVNQLLQWIHQGKMKYEETITKGFENMPKAFIGMLRGENFGKAVVKA